MVQPAATELVSDPVLRAVGHLTGPGAEPMIVAAMAAAGGRVEGLSITQVTHDPGRSCTVSYGVDVVWSDSTSTNELLVATTSDVGPPEGAAVLTADDGGLPPLSVGVWRYPFDPALPGLVSAVVPELAEQRFGDLVGGDTRPTVVSYRPGRRAVVRLDGRRGSVFVKVVRPARAERLATVHDRLTAAGSQHRPSSNETSSAGSSCSD